MPGLLIINKCYVFHPVQDFDSSLRLVRWLTWGLYFKSLWLVQVLNLTRRWAFALRIHKIAGHIQIPINVRLGSITSFFCLESSIVVDYRTQSNRIVLLSSIWFSSIYKTFDLVRVATSEVIINRCEGFSRYNDGSRSWAIKFSFFRHSIPRRIFTSHSYDARLEFDEFSV